jgi:hypothetical protein
VAGKLSGWRETQVAGRQKQQERITEADVSGLKYFDRLAPLLERLRDVGCQRDEAGNRQLHFDQYCLLILLYLFNPIVTSLRGLQQASELAKVQKRLGCPRAALGSLSESVAVFEPQRLQEIVLELGAELKPLGRDPRLKDVPGALTAVDGALLAALPRLMQASFLKRTTGSGLVKWRLHTHFEVDCHAYEGPNRRPVMTITAQPGRPTPVRSASVRGDELGAIRDVSWKFYDRLSDSIEAGSIRLAYDGKDIEIKTHGPAQSTSHRPRSTAWASTQRSGYLRSGAVTATAGSQSNSQAMTINTPRSSRAGSCTCGQRRSRSGLPSGRRPIGRSGGVC